MKRRRLLQKSVLAASLVALACAGVNVSETATAAGLTKKAPDIRVSVNGTYTFEQGAVQWDGITYLNVKEVNHIFGDAALVENASAGTFTLLYPGMKAVYTTGQRSVIVNGKKHVRDYASVKRTASGTYIALRELSDRLQGGISFNSQTRTVVLNYKERYAVGRHESTSVWVDKQNGTLYISKQGQLPQAAGQTSFKPRDLVYVTFKQLSNASLLVTISDSWGEPHLGMDYYKIIVHNGKVVREAKTSYYGFRSSASIDQAGNNLLLIDQGKLHWVRPDGVTVQSLDIGSRLGLQDVFTVEYADQDVLLIRPYTVGKLILYNMKTGTATELYKKLLTEEEQEILDTWVTSEADYPGDQLWFAKLEGNTLFFKHRVLLRSEEKVLRYTLE
ncbi:hypothetical protein FHS18_005046 [Paenibacillus phyllosphaerae]|uniref:Copper amine oxidase-like N-terminal domain-containing protein n=1 Tax=Paenibacillus phyllosphaerae TaxID=274593 RepID=A0A7W5B2F6_9BACL|nr:hypothetical protein [Paenibacillus phyllosphaerae]MBB3112944.1 hypothetical protein [Paenibacillus phyllosphaerae]